MKKVLLIGLLLATPAIADENKIGQDDKLLKGVTVAQFKGDCLRMGSKLSYNEGQWTCTGKSSDKGLTSIPIALPK
jgi:hypothetical protein